MRVAVLTSEELAEKRAARTKSREERKAVWARGLPNSSGKPSAECLADNKNPAALWLVAAGLFIPVTSAVIGPLNPRSDGERGLAGESAHADGGDGQRSVVERD